jgi:hypothetical protein
MTKNTYYTKTKIKKMNLSVRVVSIRVNELKLYREWTTKQTIILSLPHDKKSSFCPTPFMRFPLGIHSYSGQANIL